MLVCFVFGVLFGAIGTVGLLQMSRFMDVRDIINWILKNIAIFIMALLVWLFRAAPEALDVYVRNNRFERKIGKASISINMANVIRHQVELPKSVRSCIQAALRINIAAGNDPEMNEYGQT